MAATTTTLDVAAMALALTGDSTTEPVMFARSFLRAVEGDLTVLEECLQSEDPDTSNASRCAFRLGLRVSLAEKILAHMHALQKPKGAST